MNTKFLVYTEGDAASFDRRSLVGGARRIVVKIGSGVLADATGVLDLARLKSLATDMAELVKNGREVVLVSSGAVSAGLGSVIDKKPQLAHQRTLPDKQALAAIGQSHLIEAYNKAFGEHGVGVAQVLLTRADMNDRDRYINARTTLERLLEWGVVPIINENDTTATEELNLGDNDELSAIVGRKMKADLLVMLTNANGLMSSDPREKPDAHVVKVITELHDEGIEKLRVAPSKSGRGGIQGKLRAARLAWEGGLTTVVAQGEQDGLLGEICRGESDAGTLIVPRPGPRPNPVRSFLVTAKGGANQRIVINAGAADALLNKGASLLPVGVSAVEGHFKAGDVVTIVEESGAELARGIARYDDENLRRLVGKRTADIENILGDDDYNGPEAVHRDFMALLGASGVGN